jgi:hypothetical protein
MRAIKEFNIWGKFLILAERIIKEKRFFDELKFADKV